MCCRGGPMTFVIDCSFPHIPLFFNPQEFHRVKKIHKKQKKMFNKLLLPSQKKNNWITLFKTR